MSNRFDLRIDELAPGVSYACAYTRLAYGWDRARAVSELPIKRAPRKTYNERMAIYHAKREKVLARKQERVFAWERAGWNTEARLDRVVKPKTPRKRYVPKIKPDKSHPLLAAYCDEFIKTGNLNPEIAAKLRSYADAKQRPVRDPARVSTEHDVEGPRRRRRNRNGNADSNVALDAATALG